GQRSYAPMLLKRTWRADCTCIVRFATTRGHSPNWKRRVPGSPTILESSNGPAISFVARVSMRKVYGLSNKQWNLIHAILTRYHSYRLATYTFDVIPKRRQPSSACWRSHRTMLP